jgi:hypothetical protein
VDVSQLSKEFGVTPRSTAAAFEDFLSGLNDITSVPGAAVSGLLGAQRRLWAAVRPKASGVASQPRVTVAAAAMASAPIPVSANGAARRAAQRNAAANAVVST